MSDGKFVNCESTSQTLELFITIGRKTQRPKRAISENKLWAGNGASDICLSVSSFEMGCFSSSLELQSSLSQFGKVKRNKMQRGFF